MAILRDAVCNRSDRAPATSSDKRSPRNHSIPGVSLFQALEAVWGICGDFSVRRAKAVLLQADAEVDAVGPDVDVVAVGTEIVRDYLSEIVRRVFYSADGSRATTYD